MIDLHHVRTPNGLKPVIMLEECGLDYRVIAYDIFAGDHLKPEFGRINPNFRLPAIVDHAPAFGGPPLPVFETGAILFYLAEKAGRLLPSDPRRRMEAMQWLVWQVAGLGPMLGQAAHFVRYAPEGNDYAVQRYRREGLRLLTVLENRLREEEYLAGDYSIADIACWTWTMNIRNVDADFEMFPAIGRWHHAIREREAVQRAVNGDETSVPQAWLKRRMELTPEQWSNMFGEAMHAAPRGQAV